MRDYFGYQREVRPNGQLATSEYAVLSLGGVMGLVQQATATYSQVVNAKFEAGSPTLFWVTGQPSGVIQFARLVGKEGIFASFGSIEGKCGELIGVQISLNGTGGCASARMGGGGIRFSGGVAENVTLSYQAGLLEIQEGAVIRVASMARA